MKLAFCVYKYLPFGGMQRNFLRIARECRERGHEVRVYCLSWEGEMPEGLDVIRVPVKALSNIGRYRRYSRWVNRHLAAHPVDRVVGFNKMPGLDVYYAGDPCFADKAITQRPWWYRYTARYRHFIDYEQAVFGPEAGTRIMLVSQPERALFEKHYGTPAERFYQLPPGISRDRRAPDNADEIRVSFRRDFGLEAHEWVLLQVGSDFRRKGVDRSIAALAALPAEWRRRTRLLVVGEDSPDAFRAQAHSAGIGDRVQFPGGREDVLRFYLGADLFLHPARHENTGNVILEAMVAGVPSLVTAVCGYAGYVRDADAGAVLEGEFRQGEMNRVVAAILADESGRRRWHENALQAARTLDLYSRPERAADIILEEGKSA